MELVITNIAHQSGIINTKFSHVSNYGGLLLL